jgi:hypothetical protein
MAGLARLIDRHATPRNAVVATAIALAFIGLFWLAARLLHLGGVQAIGAPRPRPPAELARIARGMPDAARRGFVVVTLVLDTFFPLAYGASLALTSACLLARVNAPPPWRALRLVPAAAVACDYLENVCIVLLLHFRVDAAAVPLFTPGKWLSVSISLLVIVVSALLLLVRRLRKT